MMSHKNNADHQAQPEPDPEPGEEIEVSPEAAELLQRLQTERDEAIGARQRALADFANYQRRAMDNELRARQQGTASVIRSILPALDHFDLALAQDMGRMTAEHLVNGIQLVRDEFSKALETHGVTRVEPDAGEPFDPLRHEAVMQQEAEGVPPGHVVKTLQAGYAVGEQVLRPAKVIVAPTQE